MLTNRLNMDLPHQAWAKKNVYGVAMQWHSGKEKDPGAAVR